MVVLLDRVDWMTIMQRAFSIQSTLHLVASKSSGIRTAAFSETSLTLRSLLDPSRKPIQP